MTAKTQTVAKETGRCMEVDLVSTIAAERPVCLSCFDWGSGGLGVLQEERTGARMGYIHHELRLGVRGCRVGVTAIKRSLQESCGVLGGVFGQEGSRESEK